MKRLLILLIIIAASCSVIGKYTYPDQVNKRLLTRLTEKYNKESGNCFYVNSTYSRHATVWHYTDRRIIIDYLQNGRIKQTKQYDSNGLSIIDTLIIDPMEFDEDGWNYALDGDGLYISIQNRKYEFNLPIDISSSLNNESKTSLRKFIVDEMTRYHIFR
jgi:hypothetical protein